MKPTSLLFPLLALLIPVAQAPAQTTAESAAPAVGPVTGLPMDDAVVNAIYEVRDEDMLVMDWLDQLSNGIGPRLTSSKKLTEACFWAKGRFYDFGLSNSRVEMWGKFPVGFDRGPGFARMTQPEKRELVAMTRAWTAGTNGTERGLAFRAPATEEEMEALQGKLEGAWIVTSSNTNAPRFDGEGDELRDRFGDMCEAEGIAGIVRPGPQGNLLRTGGRSQIDPENLPKRVNVYIRRDQFRTIWQMLEDNERVELEFHIDNQFNLKPDPLYNVMAEIPGTDLADQLVIVGGHIDSWDGARGAQDNGTGTATTLEAARLLMMAMEQTGEKPRRTIRFMLWSGEEQGLLGSKAYIEAHPEENERISAVLVHDGGTNCTSGIVTPPDMEDMFGEAFAPIIAKTAHHEDEDLRFRLVERNSLPYGVGSDHDSYLAVGVPGFFWQQNGDTSYGYIHHTQHDLIDEVVPEYQHASARSIAAGAWRIANMEPSIPRENLPQGRSGGGNRKALGVFLSEDGVTIEELVNDGLAKKAGLKKGDKILSIGNKKVANQGDLRRALRSAGDSEKVVWQRGEQTMAAVFDWKANKTEAVSAQ